MKSKTFHVLVGVSAAMVLPTSFLAGMAHAITLNCQTQQCVQVRFENDGNGHNKYCWIITDTLSRAYSTTYANTGYGQDSIGGTAGTQVAGHYFKCDGTNDCAQNPTPASGTASNYQGNAVNDNFNTVCTPAG